MRKVFLAAAALSFWAHVGVSAHEASDTIRVTVSNRDTLRHIAIRNVFDGDTLPVCFHRYEVLPVSARMWRVQDGDTLRFFVIPARHFGEMGLNDTIYVRRIQQFRGYDLSKVIAFLPLVKASDGRYSVFRRPVERIYINRRCLRMDNPKTKKRLKRVKGRKVEAIYVIPYSGADRLGSPEIRVKKRRWWHWIFRI